MPTPEVIRSIVPMSLTLEALIEPLLHSPRLPEIAEALQVRLRDEAARRVRFYADMTDAEKVEFIEGEVVMHSPARNMHLIAQMNIQQLLTVYVVQQRAGAVRGEPGDLIARPVVLSRCTEGPFEVASSPMPG